ncbi:MAG: M23 family metallopeptidase, partial [Candidatus Bathyarchaeia archaeon]
FDYVILLQSSENFEKHIKILHVKPTVKVGDVVKPGDQLGFLLRSGFFDFWTEPHMHIEVRKPSDPIRARGGLKFERLMAIENFETKPEELRGVVFESKREYSLLVLHGTFNHGIPVRVGEEMGLLDGGIPHYKWFGVHMASSQPPLNSVVKLCGAKIGTVKALYSKMCASQCSDLTFKINGKPVSLGFYLHLSKPLVKIIPKSIGALKLEKFDEVAIAIS